MWLAHGAHQRTPHCSCRKCDTAYRVPRGRPPASRRWPPFVLRTISSSPSCSKGYFRKKLRRHAPLANDKGALRRPIARLLHGELRARDRLERFGQFFDRVLLGHGRSGLANDDACRLAVARQLEWRRSEGVEGECKSDCQKNCLHGACCRLPHHRQSPLHGQTILMGRSLQSPGLQCCAVQRHTCRFMPDASQIPDDLSLTPHGLLLVANGPPPSPWPDVETGCRVVRAFAESPARGLVHLATRELHTALPPAAAWWRELARRYLTQVCHIPDLDRMREIAPIPPPDTSELETLADTAPPMRGGEYLSAETLARLWVGLDALVRAEVAQHPQGAGAWLKESHPLWRMVGRVTFHLAENKRHPTHPFAFMASYASRISAQSRVQHLPLGRALQEYAGAGNKPALLNLLSPVQRAAEKSGFVRELVDSGRVFKALPWTPAEAYRFLRDAPVCEEAGLLVRLPDWWKGGRPPRPRVSVRVGQNRTAGLGADTLLDFSVETTIEGEPLTEEEWQSLLQAADGLALVRGKWVEVDPAKLREALAHWKKVETLARRDGLTFFDGMRMIAGFRTGAATAEEEHAPDVDREWSGIQPGQWLDQVLAELRDPSRLGAVSAIPGLHAQLRPYQALGVHWLEFLAQLRLGRLPGRRHGLGQDDPSLGAGAQTQDSQPSAPPPASPGRARLAPGQLAGGDRAVHPVADLRDRPPIRRLESRRVARIRVPTQHGPGHHHLRHARAARGPAPPPVEHGHSR